MAMRFLVVLSVSIVVALTIWGWKVVSWVWLRPRKLEKQLRKQGFKGNSYKILFGDFKEQVTLLKEAKSKPINLSHDILALVSPIDHKLLVTYGRDYFIWLGPQPMVNIMDPNLIREILFKQNIFQKPKLANPLGKLIICGLATHEGEKWAKHRRMMDPAFHFNKLKHMLPAFYMSCMEMIGKWEEIVAKKDGSCELNVWPDLQALSADVISHTAFGSSYEEGRRIFELQKEQGELLVETARSIYLPGSRFLPTKRNRRMKEINRHVKASIMSIIDKRLNAKEPTKTSDTDLLSILLLNYKETEKHDKKKFGISTDEIIDECKLFYFAGQETTANLLTWTMILLGQHQNWQEQARQEVLHVFGKNQPDHGGLSHLKIISMILYEVLRLYPPVIVIRRIVNEETKVEDITLPAGTIIQVPILMLNHDQDIWGDDAKEFKPERFYEGVAKATKAQGSFIPFGGGPRTCIGQNFALLEAKMAVAMILQRFSFSVSTSYSHAPHSVMTLEPQHGAHLILQKV